MPSEAINIAIIVTIGWVILIIIDIIIITVIIIGDVVSRVYCASRSSWISGGCVALAVHVPGW